MGQLKQKYNQDYFLGGVDSDTGRAFGVLGHEEFRNGRTHERHVKEFEFTRSFIGSLRGKDVLDIGFGRGDHIVHFLDAGVGSYDGIDFSESAVEIAASKFSDPRLRLSHGEAKELDAELAYDLILMYDVVEHLPVFEMEAIWPVVHRALKPKGILVISTPIFDNPNVTDHSDEIPSVCGMHCNKQTEGTILRSCLKHGFTVASNDDRIFTLIRTEDLQLFDAEKRREYSENHSKLLARYGVTGLSREISSVTGKRLVPGAGRVAMGCVADNHPKYLSQALRLLQSVRWLGGSMAGVNFFVCIVDEVDPYWAGEFERLGAFVRKVPRFSNNHPHSNKLRFFELPELKAYDTVMFLDCDTVVVQDPWPLLDGEKLQTKIADLPTVPVSAFDNLFRHFGLESLPVDYRCTYDKTETPWYCNSGVIVLPVGLLEGFVGKWRHYNSILAENLDILGEHSNFCDQASLTLAFAESPMNFQELPVSMNFPLHLIETLPKEMMNCDPVILHYHDRIDELGFLQNSPYPGAQKKIEMFNQKLRESRNRNFDNRTFWDFRYSQFPELGSGVGSRGEQMEFKRKLLKGILDSQNGTVLDIGCGDLSVSEDVIDGRYSGVDISPVIIERNRLKLPESRFICGDFLDIELERADMVLCLDVLIHLSKKEAYTDFVNKVVRLTQGFGVISGYENDPNNKGGMVFFHEPLSLTLKRSGARAVRKLGKYNNVVIYYYETGKGADMNIDFLKADENIEIGIKPKAQRMLNNPVFIIGSMRSGTTLLANLLGRFDGIIHCPFELKDIWSNSGIPQASAKTRDTICHQMHAGDAIPDYAERLTGAFLERMARVSEGKREDAVFLSKNPHLCNKLPFVNALFPDARFIWIHRSLPQVAASLGRLFEDVLKRQQTWHYWPEPYAGTVERCWHAAHDVHPEHLDPERVFPGGRIRHIAEYWIESNRAVADYLKTLPADRWLEVSENELVRSPEAKIKRCLEFLGEYTALPSDIGAGMDPARNDVWESELTDLDKRVLKFFLKSNREEILRVFPSWSYEVLGGPEENDNRRIPDPAPSPKLANTVQDEKANSTTHSVDDLVELGEKHAVEGNFQMALEIFQKISKEEPEDHRNWNNMGVMLSALNRTGEAKACLIRALSLKGDYEDAIENLKAIAEANTMKSTEAMDKTTKPAPEEEALPLQRYIDEAAALVKEGKIEEAISSFSALAGLYPELKEVYPVLCDLYIKDGRTDIPADWIKAAVRYDASFEKTFLELSSELYSGGRCKEAVNVISALLEAAPENHKGWNNYAVMLCSLGADIINEAEQSLNKSLSIKGDDPEAIDNLKIVNELKNSMETILKKAPVEDKA